MTLTPEQTLCCPACGHLVATVGKPERRRSEASEEEKTESIRALLRENPTITTREIQSKIGGRAGTIARLVRTIRTQADAGIGLPWQTHVAPAPDAQTLDFAEIAWPAGFEPGDPMNVYTYAVDYPEESE